MNLTFTPSAWADYQWFVQHDRKLVKRINQLVQDILRAPFEGIGARKGDADSFVLRTVLSSFFSSFFSSFTLRVWDTLSARERAAGK